MSSRATGRFDVKMTPVGAEAQAQASGTGLGHMVLEKQLHGELEGTSRGEMLTASTAVEGSAGYVAIEQVSANLKGRTGTFVLLHQGTMQKGGEFELTILVVPDSGTGELTGIRGTMRIGIAADGVHSYELEYELP